MQSLIRRLFSFEDLIGPALVKLVYYVGAAGIAMFIGATLLAGVMSLAGGNFGAGAMQLLAAPAVGVVAFVYWRFLCELFILAFLAYDRLGEVRDLMRIAAGQTPPDGDHPEF
jgi:hypothetical protein